jgi:hypothetical protein
MSLLSLYHDFRLVRHRLNDAVDGCLLFGRWLFDIIAVRDVFEDSITENWNAMFERVMKLWEYGGV